MTLLLVLQLSAIFLPAMPPPPPPPAIFAVQDVPNRGPNEGKWAHQVGHTCWRLEEREFQHHCECKQLCDGMGNEHEDNTCATYCASRENGASSQCVCHADSGTCPGPEIEAPKKGQR